MKVLVTGSRGFVGKNLVESLKCIRDGKDRRSLYQAMLPLEIFEYDRDSSFEDLDAYCREADFVFNLAGVNRPQNSEEYMAGNFGFAQQLLETLEKYENKAPIMLSSSVQAELKGRYANSEYGKSKLAGEELFLKYSERTKIPILIYRLPNLYGKWCRPNYNSAVATFCYNIANDLPVTVNDPSVERDLLYIDDLVSELLSALIGKENRIGGGYCSVAPVDRVSIGEIVSLIKEFNDSRASLCIPNIPRGSFSKKLLTTFMSYMPPEKFALPLRMNEDERGSFTEVLHTHNAGQVSVNVSKPGVIKGQHWHHTKWEKFCVVSGHGLMQLRKVGKDENGSEYPVLEFEVTGDELQVVDMIPGYTHNIVNLSNEQNLVTVMWCNECFDPDYPDTFALEV